jgi:hypothetical protein
MTGVEKILGHHRCRRIQLTPPEIIDDVLQQFAGIGQIKLSLDIRL